MGLRVRKIVSALGCVVLFGCGSSDPFAPIDPESVAIELSVSGGIVGQSYSFVIDGAAGEVRGLACSSFCDFEPGELIVPISRAQIEDLARRLEEAAVFARDGDYGSQCCDDIGFDLRYRSVGGSARVRGGLSRIPSDLSAAISHVSTFGHRRVPLLVSRETDASDWPRDPYTLIDVTVTGLELRAQVRYGGGCALHAMDLVAWGGWMEASPVQINALITHDDGGDTCEALLQEERAFNLSPLVSAYRATFGSGMPGPQAVVLRLWDPTTGSQTERLVRIDF